MSWGNFASMLTQVDISGNSTHIRTVISSDSVDHLLYFKRYQFKFLHTAPLQQHVETHMLCDLAPPLFLSVTLNSH